MIKFFFILFSSTILLTGCISGNYQSFKSGVGYSSNHKQDNVYMVTYVGTASTKIEKINDFALLRSAELTIETGYNYFVISEAINNKTLASNSNNNSGQRLSGDDPDGFMGVDAGFSAGAIGSAPAIRKRPKSSLTIHLYKEKPEGIAYDAHIIKRALRSEYEVERAS